MLEHRYFISIFADYPWDSRFIPGLALSQNTFILSLSTRCLRNKCAITDRVMDKEQTKIARYTHTDISSLFNPYLLKLTLSLYLYNNHELQYNTHDRQDRLHLHFPPAVYMHALSFYKR